MGWISKIFSNIGATVIKESGKVLDGLFTSDEEIALTDIQKARIEAAYQVRIREIMLDADRQAAAHEATLEKELTERLALDMKSDSRLSKNIRPLTLVFMTAVVSILAFATIFNSDLTAEQLNTVESWIPFFQTIMITIYGFYFGSRGLEKVQKIRTGKQE